VNDSVRSAVQTKRIQAGLLLLILLLATGLRFYRPDAQSLWNDEGTSVAVAQRDLATIARDAAQDIHPPLYYWLLHSWVKLMGTSEVGVRSLSAMLGVVLVVLVYLLGQILAGRWAGLAAALLAAINPFQVYYSQEARMYMLLAVWSALAFYAALRWASSTGREQQLWSGVYVMAGAAGLYTHYAFPLVLVAVNLLFLLFVNLDGEGRSWWWRGGYWLALQAAILLIFLPWLPTAIQQLATWPRVDQPTNLITAVTAIAQLLLAGPAAPPLTENIALLLLLVLIFLPSRGSKRLPPLVAGPTPALWLVVPVVLILGLGLYKEAYLKFLLVVSPAFCLLAGRFLTAPLRGERIFRSGTIASCALLALYFLYASCCGLHNYFTDPAYARDDYRGIADYIEAVGRPGDAVLLNAPGQQEVFGYYYHGALPVYPLPESRPLDPAATESALEALAQPAGRVFAVLWATDESDPGRFVESWLDTHAYKALDSWYGNVRLVVYAVPERTSNVPDHRLNIRFRSQENDDEIVLLGYSQLGDQLAAGDIAQITLFLRAERTPAQRYKVFLHVLDASNQIVGQRDAEPGGGAQLTTLWQPGEVVADNYGLPIHPATPPGEYSVEVGLYNLETGQRLLTPEGEWQVWLEPLAVERPPAPAPVAALGMQRAADADFGELTLLGYDAHKLGYDEYAPLYPGDLLLVALYWRAEAQPGGDWHVVIALLDAGGKELVRIMGEPAGDYPTSHWLAGDVWRGQFNLAIPGSSPPGRYRLKIQPITPDGSAPEPFLSKPLVLYADG
jgi:mannosyltransferase